MAVKGRFAPSPTGRMHLGNIYSALLSWLSARSKGGEWLLRHEDLDPSRCRREYALQIEDDLRWLGLEWDEGGLDARGNLPSYCQSERVSFYADALSELEKKNLTYPCWCTRADILATQAPHESDGRVVYAGTCRNLRATHASVPDRKPSTRIIVPDTDIIFEDANYGRQTVNLARHCGDFVVRRSDGAWAYQLAVVVDDALMGVTEVVRGRDLLLSAAQQIYLYRLLGYQEPLFAHIPLICSKSGERLCKRDKAADMSNVRASSTPEQVIGQLAYIAGIIDTPQPCKAEELIPWFSWSRIGTDDIIL